MRNVPPTTTTVPPPATTEPPSFGPPPPTFAFTGLSAKTTWLVSAGLLALVAGAALARLAKESRNARLDALH